MSTYMVDGKKMMNICILEILRKYTDSEHTMDQKDIIKKLETEYGMKVDRKSVKSNLMNLVDFGYNLECTEIERENKIITDLLSLVKMDKTSGVLNITTINISELCEQILKRIKPIAAERNIELIFESYRAIMAEVDEVKLSLAINNLIENAVKYNYDNGWVRVSLNADHKFFYIKVADSGVGIPEDEQDNVFERFYRVDKSLSREIGGTGLGLAIARSGILMHHGIIKVYSEEGEGTTFTVRVPLTYSE